MTFTTMFSRHRPPAAQVIDRVLASQGMSRSERRQLMADLRGTGPDIPQQPTVSAGRLLEIIINALKED
ncbi:MAG: hypothetical protein ACRED5_12675 [Propylenella sp.]